jgi:hypothetical protein
LPQQEVSKTLVEMAKGTGTWFEVATEGNKGTSIIQWCTQSLVAQKDAVKHWSCTLDEYEEDSGSTSEGNERDSSITQSVEWDGTTTSSTSQDSLDNSSPNNGMDRKQTMHLGLIGLCNYINYMADQYEASRSSTGRATAVDPHAVVGAVHDGHPRDALVHTLGDHHDNVDSTCQGPQGGSPSIPLASLPSTHAHDVLPLPPQTMVDVIDISSDTD